jgi:hypothetical protein
MAHLHQRSILPSALLIASVFVGLATSGVNRLETAVAAPPHQPPAPIVQDAPAAQVATGTLSYTVSIPLVIRARTTCLNKPTLVSPQNGALLTTIVPTYTFLVASTPVTHTIIDIADNPLFRPRYGGFLMYGLPNKVISIRAFENMQLGKTYYWRAYSVCGDNTSDFSAVYTFTTASSGVVLPAPTLLSPASNISGVGSTLTLSWTPIAGADGYRMRYGPAASSGFNLGGTFPKSPFELKFLRPNTVYEWSVSAVNEFGYGTESEKRRFTTGSFSQ